jgi:hypothetical protein
MAAPVLDLPAVSASEVTPARKQLVVWIGAEFCAALDRWRANQPDAPSRVEAFRRLAMLGLAGELLGGSKATRRKR